MYVAISKDSCIMYNTLPEIKKYLRGRGIHNEIISYTIYQVLNREYAPDSTNGEVLIVKWDYRYKFLIEDACIRYTDVLLYDKFKKYVRGQNIINILN